MNYAKCRALVTKNGATIEGLQGAPLKRIKINSITIAIFVSDMHCLICIMHIRHKDGATKSVRFTVHGRDKRMPVKAEFAHLCVSGFRLPRGHHVHCVV